MSVRFSGQNEVEVLNEEVAVGDIITIKLRNHFGQDSKNQLVCEVTEILQRTNESRGITARVRFRSQVNDGYQPSQEDYERRNLSGSRGVSRKQFTT